MPTAKFVCGAECGIAVVGTTSAGTEHWSLITGTPTVVTSGPATMRSTRCFRLNTTAAGARLAHAYATAIASPATIVMRAYFYFATLPSANCALITDNNTACGAYFNQSDSKIYAGQSTSVFGATGVTVTTGQWYRIDVKVVSDTTRTADVQVDGVACGQQSAAAAANAAGTVLFGHFENITADMYIDDIIVSGTSADYPIGAGTVVGLYPRADGTHGGAWASGVFGKSTSGATNAANTDTDIWASLDKPLTDTAAGSWVSDLTGTVTTNYVEFLSDATPSNVSSVNGAMLVSTLHCTTTTASNSQVFVADGSTSVALINIAANVTTITIPVAVRNTDASGVAWTKTTIDAVKTRFTSTDSNPDVYLDGYVWEVDYVPTVVGAAFIARAPVVVAQAVNRAAVIQMARLGRGQPFRPIFRTRTAFNAATASADVAAATGAAGQPVVSVAVFPATAAATGTAGQPTVTAGKFVDAGLASATGTAGQPTASVGAAPSRASATGTAGQPTVSVSVFAGVAAATGTAYQPAASLGVAAARASATGAAGQPTASVGAAPSCASATGAAFQPNASLGVAAGRAAATGAAGAPTANVGAVAGNAAGTGTAYDATISVFTGSGNVSVNAGLASAAGTANNPTASIGAAPGAASATGAAAAPTASIGSAPSRASATGAANQPTISVSSFPGAAAATGTAGAPTPSIGAVPTAATATGSAYNAVPVAGINAAAGVASATGVARQPTVSISVFPTVAAATGTAYLPAISTGTFLNAGLATATGVARQPTISIGAAPATATGTGSAGAPTPSLGVNAGRALATGTAYQPTISNAVEAPDPNAITLTIRDQHHTATVADNWHTVTLRERRHGVLSRPRHGITIRERRHLVTIQEQHD